MLDAYAAQILASNDERFDVATSPELALLAGMPLPWPKDRGSMGLTIQVDAEPESANFRTVPCK